MKKNFYAVVIDSQALVFNSWDKCNRFIKQNKGSLLQHKGFSTEEEAFNWGLKLTAEPKIGVEEVVIEDQGLTIKDVEGLVEGLKSRDTLKLSNIYRETASLFKEAAKLSGHHPMGLIFKKLALNHEKIAGECV